MKKSFYKYFLGLFVVTIFGCKMYKDPSSTEDLVKESLPSDFVIPEEWSKIDKADAEVRENWYEIFNEPKLNSLIVEALDTTNPSIRYQLSRIEASSANVRIAKTGNKVFMNYDGAYGGNSVLDGKSNYDIGLSAPISWEPDLWGKIEAGVLAADENVISQILNYTYTRQSIAGTVCDLYFDIATIQRGLEIGEDYISINQRLVDILNVKQDVGIIDKKDVYLAEAQYSSIQSIIEDFNNSLQSSTRALEALIGRYPNATLSIDWLGGELQPIDAISDPVSLIRRRPDIMANEANVRSAFYLTEQAKLAKYPSLVISASPGITTAGTLVLGTGASLLGPILNGGLIEANIDGATANQKALVSIYGLSIIDALKEVETALDSETILYKRRQFTQDVVDESRNAYDVAVTQYREGKIDLLNALQLQSQLLLTELELIRITQAIYKQRVRLYLSLGGNITEY